MANLILLLLGIIFIYVNQVFIILNYFNKSVETRQ